MVHLLVTFVISFAESVSHLLRHVAGPFVWRGDLISFGMAQGWKGGLPEPPEPWVWNLKTGAEPLTKTTDLAEWSRIFVFSGLVDGWNGNGSKGGGGEGAVIR